MYGELNRIEQLETENRELRTEVAALKEVNEQLLTDATKLFVKRMMAEDLGEGKWHGEIQFSPNPGIDAIGMFAYETLKEHNAPKQRLAELENEKNGLIQEINRLKVRLFNKTNPELCMDNGHETKQSDMTVIPPVGERKVSHEQ